MSNGDIFDEASVVSELAVVSMRSTAPSDICIDDVLSYVHFELGHMRQCWTQLRRNVFKSILLSKII